MAGGNYITNLFDTSGMLTDTWLKKSGGTVLDHHDYTYDQGFNRRAATRGPGGAHLDYLHDSIGQLTNALAYDTGGIGIPRLNEKFGFAPEAEVVIPAEGIDFLRGKAVVIGGGQGAGDGDDVAKGVVGAAISREYWAANGPAEGSSLHHWLFPQSATWVPQGFRNAGFNLLDLPPIIDTPFGGLNQ